MSEELLSSIPVLIPDIESSIEIHKEDLSAAENYSNPHLEFETGQSVRFLKVTVLYDGKISYKETYGKIANIDESSVEIIDILGDTVVCSIYNIKPLISQESEALNPSILSVV